MVIFFEAKIYPEAKYKPKTHIPEAVLEVLKYAAQYKPKTHIPEAELEVLK